MLITDTESDGFKFEATRLWCIVSLCTDENLWYISIPDEANDTDVSKKIQESYPHIDFSFLTLRDHVHKLKKSQKVAMHNGIMHDAPLINRLYGVDLTNIEDTFILSSLFNPDRNVPSGWVGKPKPHSIEAYAMRFGMVKVGHDDWTCFSWNMLDRCINDVMVGHKTLTYLEPERKAWDWDTAIRIEYSVARLQAKQEMHGFLFDSSKALELLEKIDSEVAEIDSIAAPQIPPKIVKVGEEVKKPFKKDGTYTKYVETIMAEGVPNIRGPFSKVMFHHINLNSSDQVKGYLLSKGWKPTQWNYKKDGKRWVYDDKGDKIKTSPKLTEDSFDTVEGDIPKLIARRNILKHRRSLIENLKDPENKGWLSHIRSDGRLEAAGVPMSCNTGRWRHANIVNVPSSGSVYGEEIRGLFIAPPNRVLVGGDAKAIEARCQAHNTIPFTGGVEYSKILLEGDIHEHNAKSFECKRNDAKSPYYAIIYGASPAKVAETLGVSLKQGEKLYNQFWDGCLSLKELKESLVAEYKSNGGKRGGYIRGLDGRKLMARSEHSLVNLKFQSDAAILFKTALVFLFSNWIPKSGITANLVCTMHDELQAEVAKDDVAEYTRLLLAAFEAAGRYYKYLVPIVGDVKVGMSWAETH